VVEELLLLLAILDSEFGPYKPPPNRPWSPWRKRHLNRGPLDF
jgi:hypothetical protein